MASPGKQKVFCWDVEVESRLAALRSLWAAVDAELDRLSFSSSWRADMHLVVMEGATNAIVHGHGEDGRPLRLELDVFEEGAARRVEVRIIDSGEGFEWPSGEVPVPDVLAESGRGIFLMKNLTDESEYRHGAGQNALVLRKSAPKDG